MDTDVKVLAEAYFEDLKNYGPERFKGFDLNEKSQGLVERFKNLTEDFPPERIEKEKKIPEDLLKKLKSDGFFGISISEEYGGGGLDIFQYLAIVEQLISRSMSVGLTVLAHLSIGVKGIELFGNRDQKRKYLPLAASGEMVFSYALTEPEIGSDARHIQTTVEASEDGEHYILNGTKAYITNANYADAMTVFANFDNGKMGAFIVETHWDGVSVGKEMPKMGLKGSSTAMVRFDRVNVPKENLLGGQSDGFKIAMTILNHGRLALGAASSGMIRVSLEDMIQRAKSRKQFDESIIHFDLIREKLVHAKVNAAVSRAMTAHCAAMVEKEPLVSVAVESSHCKLFGTTRAWKSIYDALQVAGGSGYLSTLPFERRTRDFRVTTIFEGTTEIHSIYPALFLIRKFTDILKKQRNSIKGKACFVFKSLIPEIFNPINVRHKKLKPAGRAAMACVRKISLLILWGLIRHGEKIKKRQYFLRRISFLSMYAYGILAMISQIETAMEDKKPVEKDLVILRFFVRLAKDYKKHHTGLVFGKKDSLKDAVFKIL